MIKPMSPLTNGAMTPPPAQSPSVAIPPGTQTQLQTQQTIPIGQQVALVTSGTAASSAPDSAVPHSATPPLASIVRPATSLSAISSPSVASSATSSAPPQLVISQPSAQKSFPAVAQKSAPTPVNALQHQPQQPQQAQPTLLIQTSKDGQSVFLSNPTMAHGAMRAPVTVSSAGNQLVFAPRMSGVTSASTITGPNGQLIQFVNVNNSPSRPGLVPVSGNANSQLAGMGRTTTTTLQPRVVQLPHNIRLSNPGTTVGRPGGVVNAMNPMGLQPNLMGQRILLKTENGQYQMVTMPGLAGGLPHGTLIRAPGQPGTLVQQHQPGAPGTQTAIRAGTQIVLNPSVSLAQTVHHQQQQQQAKLVVGGGAPGMASAHQVSVPSHTPLTIQTSAANSQAASAAPSQMSPTTAKKKCKNFLSTLIRLASDQPEQVANNVKQLIQGLVDDTIQPEDFTNQLQKELNSSPQPCLVPFLKKSLPYLRYSLIKEELTIEGVRAPHANNVTITPNGMAIGNGNAQAAVVAQMAAQQQHQQQQQQQQHPLMQHLSAQRAGQMAAQGIRLIGPPGTSLGQMGTQQILTSLAPGNLSAPMVFTSMAGQQLQLGGQHTAHLQNHLASGGMVTTSLPQGGLAVHRPTMNPPLHQTHLNAPVPPQLQQQPQQHSHTCSLGTPPVRAPTPSKAKAPAKTKKERAEEKKKAALAAAAAAAAAATAATASLGPLFPPTGPSHSSTSGPGAAAGGGGAGAGEKTSSSFKDDDDINDVAAMGGVNLQEESQRILGTNAEIIGQTIRSCGKDDTFLHASPLHNKIRNILKRHELSDCPPEVVSLISHAVQERLKTLVERLGTIAEHRQEQFKNNDNYEVIQDVKGQVQFLQELDRIEKKRHEEQEREVLIKAAKSRSKMDDPDHLAIKARAKEMQRLEMEEIRQREANETALQAIGFPKKRQKTGSGPSAGASGSGGSGSAHSASNSSSLAAGAGGGGGGGFSGSSAAGAGHRGGANSTSATSGSAFTSFSSKPAIKRVKRVTMKDVYFMMESERQFVRSPLLFRTYAR